MQSSSSKKEVWQEYFEVDSEKILYKDDHVVAFPDRSPGATIHLLVVPRFRYIKGVEDLQPSDRPLLEIMKCIGQQLSTCKSEHMGFHQWPMRSVNHLHLHCVVPPFRPAWQKLRYTELVGKLPRYGFIGFDSVMDRLASE